MCKLSVCHIYKALILTELNNRALKVSKFLFSYVFMWKIIFFKYFDHSNFEIILKFISCSDEKNQLLYV